MKSFSTCRRPSAPKSGALLRALLVFALICAGPMGHGLDPQKSYSQYLRTRWTVRNGFPGGRINAIVQTTDGFLWIGTGKGLVRFDSFSFVSVGKANRLTTPISQALMLVAAADGALWVWDQDMNIQRYLHNAFEEVSSSSAEQRGAVAAIAPWKDGGVLVATQAPRVFGYRNGKSDELTGINSLGIPSPQAIASTTDGRIWMATYQAGLFYWSAGHATAVTEGLPDSKINCMLPVEDGRLWIGTDRGIVQWDGHQISAAIPSGALRGTRVLSLAKDHNGNLWIGTSGGLFRLNSAGLQQMGDGQQGQGRTVTAIFEDRENNLWVGDAEGIERLCDGPFRTYSVEEKLPAEISGPLYADTSDGVWVAPSSGGLYRIDGGQAKAVVPKQLGHDVIYSIAGAGDDLWLGRRNGGLTHLAHGMSARSGVHSLRTYTYTQGLAQNSVSSVFRSSDGTIWAGTLTGGVSRLKDHKWITLTSSDGLGSNTISSIQEGKDGAIWFATSDGLSRFANDQLKTYRARDGLPSDEVITVYANASGILWVGTSEGLAYFSLGKITAVADAHQAFHEPIFGITADAEGFLWVATANRVFRVKETALHKGEVEEGDYREYGEQDGLRGAEGVRRDRSLVSDLKGRVWLSTSHGISVVDPTTIRKRIAPPVPHVEAITADGTKASLEGSIRIAPDPQRISVAYQAVSLAVPYQVRYRYKLRGFDHNWSDSTDSREVVYTNLKPGTYHFGLLASKGDGTWSGSEDAVTFTIMPSLWESWWFRLLCGVLATTVLWLLYLYRLKLATARIQERLAARLEERERIARELHDTLLQGFQGLVLRIHGVLKTIPAHEAPHTALEHVLDRADQVLIEGREKVRDLRQVGIMGKDLRQTILDYGEELREVSSTQFKVVILGLPQALSLAIHDEVVCIAREALRNCFLHANAVNIKAEVAYSHDAFSLRISDDGVGIDRHIVDQGRAGHWGLAGMRERARKIGARFNISTTPGSGTDITITIPAKLAFSRTAKPALLERLNRYRSSGG